MAVEIQYQVVVAFTGAKHLDVQNKVQPELERLGVERNWLNVYETDFTDDSMTLTVYDADSATIIDQAIQTAVNELGGTILS